MAATTFIVNSLVSQQNGVRPTTDGIAYQHGVTSLLVYADQIISGAFVSNFRVQSGAGTSFSTGTWDGEVCNTRMNRNISVKLGGVAGGDKIWTSGAQCTYLYWRGDHKRKVMAQDDAIGTSSEQCGISWNGAGGVGFVSLGLGLDNHYSARRGRSTLFTMRGVDHCNLFKKTGSGAYELTSRPANVNDGLTWIDPRLWRNGFVARDFGLTALLIPATPTLSQDSPSNGATVGATPQLKFTGADTGGSSDLSYEIQIGTDTLFFSGGLIDSYSESNADQTIILYTSANNGAGQTFISPSNGGILDSCKFYLVKGGSPTGNANAKLYACTGTPGTDGKPTGTALAVSDNFDVSTLTTSQQLITFNFSGANRYSMAGSTAYCIAIEYYSGDLSNYITVGQDVTTATHSGNGFTLNSTLWSETPSYADTIFYVYSGATLILDKLSASDAGFANITTPADTDPFNDGDQIGFTVQSGDALTTGVTYYWRARVQVIATGVISDWTSSRSIVIGAGGPQTFTKTLTGTLSFTSAETLLIRHLMTAALSFTGTFSRSLLKMLSLSGTLSFAGGITKRTGKTLTATLSFISAITRKTIDAGFTAALSFVGALTKKIVDAGFTATLSFVGTFTRSLLKLLSLTATLSFTGAITKRSAKSLAGTLSFVGAVVKKVIGAGFTATLSFVGALTKKLIDAGFTATLSFVGAFSRVLLKLLALTASLSFAGTLSKRTGKSLTATLSFVSAQTKRIIDAGFTATLSFVGTLTKRIAHAFTATLSFVGNLATQLLTGAQHYTQAFTASLSFSGSLIKRIVDAGFAAALSFTGAIAKQAGKSLTATLSFAGTISKRTAHAFTATLSFVGALSRRTAHAFQAALSFIGALATQLSTGAQHYTQAFTATLAPTGALFKRVGRSLGATLSFVGALITRRIFARAFTATLTFSAVFGRRLGKAFSATLSFQSAMRKAIAKKIGASLSFIGNLVAGGALELVAGIVAGSKLLLTMAASVLNIQQSRSGGLTISGTESDITTTSAKGDGFRVERTK